MDLVRGRTTITASPLPTAVFAYNCSVGIVTSSHSGSWPTSATYIGKASDSIATYEEPVIVTLNGTVETTCLNYWRCGGQMLSNNDIAGIGVFVALLTAAWASFAMFAVAYWSGLLPGYQIRSANTRCFFGNGRNHRSIWLPVIEKVARIISDQQLITGLAILGAGFYEATKNDLDGYHFNIVTYQAWLCSNVHLTALSILQRDLRRNHALRTIRLVGMLSLFIMLIIALIPSSSLAFAIAAQNVIAEHPETPVRCFWNIKALHLEMKGTYDDLAPNMDAQYYREQYQDVNAGTVVSYIILYISYGWEISQLFEGSRNFLRKWLRSIPEAAMECATNYRLKRNRIHQYGSVAYCYVVFIVWMDFLESCFMSILFLILCTSMGYDHAPESSSENLLPLLLLIQPILAMAEHFASGRAPKSVVHQRINDSSNDPSSTGTLSGALKTKDCLSPAEKASGTLHDPILGHMYTSTTFKVMMWLHIAAVLVTASVGLYICTAPDNNDRFIWVGILFGSTLGWIQFCYAIAPAFTKRLR